MNIYLSTWLFSNTAVRTSNLQCVRTMISYIYLFLLSQKPSCCKLCVWTCTLVCVCVCVFVNECLCICEDVCVCRSRFALTNVSSFLMRVTWMYKFTEEKYIWSYKHISVNVRSHILWWWSVHSIISRICPTSSISFMVYVLKLAVLTYNFAVQV